MFSRGIHDVLIDFSLRFEEAQSIRDAGGDDWELALDGYHDEHPEIKAVPVDDISHCGSVLWLVPSQTEQEFMGITVFMQPECDTDHIGRICFMYPGAIEALITKLSEIKRENSGKRGWELTFEI